MQENSSSVSPFSPNIQTLRTTNALQSKTRSLPNETLSYIFQHACPAWDTTWDVFGDFIYRSTPRIPAHLVLRLVSVLWYNIVQSTPQLWTTISFVGWDKEKKHQYIKLCLENSGQLPLSLRVSQLSPLSSPVIRKMLKAHAHRIQRLRIADPPSKWLRDTIPKMSQLAELWLYRPTGLPKFTGLHRLYLIDAGLPNLHTEPLMASITCLDLQKIAIDCSIQLLINCRNLVEFSCHDHLGARALNAHILTSPVVLNNLSTFSWSTPRWQEMHLHDELFQYIRLPTLKSLGLSNSGSRKFELGSPTFTFISRLPASINELHFRSMGHEMRKRFLELFDQNMDVTGIRVDNCSPSFLRNILSSLLRPTGQGEIRFPNLTRLHVGFPALPWPAVQNPPLPLELGIAENLVTLLQKRMRTIEWFTFVSEHACFTHWNYRTWRRFKELKDAGLCLTVIECGEVVDIESRCGWWRPTRGG